MRVPRVAAVGRTRRALAVAALVFGSVLIWVYAFVSVAGGSMVGVVPSLRTHRASPLPRKAVRRRAAEQDVPSVAAEDEGAAGTLPQALAHPQSRWLASLSDAERAERAALRLDEVAIEAVSWDPRIFVLHDLLTAAECDELVRLGRPELEASTVVDTATGSGMLSQVRTSSGMFITDSTEATLLIRKRISHITLLPEENQEAISVLRYQPGQYYKPHQDFFADQTNINRGGQRTATVLIYLTDVESGGETVFPSANPGGTCDCGGRAVPGMSVRPHKGTAVLFWTMTPAGVEDMRSVHGNAAASATMQKAGTRHAKLSDSACAVQSAESLKCIESNYADKSACAPFFAAYKACKKAEYDAARAARIAANGA